MAAFLSAAAPARAAFEDVGLGARAAGLGDAVTALSDDAEVVSINPAAAGSLERTDVELSARRLFHAAAAETDMEGMTAAAGTQLHGPLEGGLAAYWTHDILGNTALDRQFGFAYGTRNWREIGPAILNLGVGVRGLSRSGRRTGGGLTRAAGDLGFSLKLSDDRSLGLSFLNLNAPRLDLPGIPDRAPLTMRFGFAQQVRRYKVLMDWAGREPSSGRRTAYAATLASECSWSTAGFGTFLARSGLTLGGLARSWSLGAGFKRLGARVDYALRIPLSSGTRWSHVVSMSWRFGSWNPETEYETLLKSEMSSRRELGKALESAELKQWRLAEELKLLREEMEALRKQSAEDAAGRGEAELRARLLEREIQLKAMERRRVEAQRKLEKMQEEQERLRRADVKLRFSDDWRAYQDLKLQGASELVLAERLKRILADYKGTEVDLGEANLEYQRLQRR
jgi:hypothetical protein